MGVACARPHHVLQVAAASLASQQQKHEIESLRVQLGLKQDIINDLERWGVCTALCRVTCPATGILNFALSELVIMKNINSGLRSTLEHATAASVAKCGELAALNAHLASEASQLQTAVTSKDEQISKLKV